MQPDIHLNYAAIAVAVAASFVFGWLWYGPLFGKTWARLMGMKMETPPPSGVIVRGMVLSVVGAFLMAYVAAHTLNVWRPSSWGLGPDQADALYGLSNALFIWLGFFVPLLFTSVAWEGRSWKLFGLNAAYQFLNLLLISMILAHWR